MNSFYSINVMQCSVIIIICALIIIVIKKLFLNFLELADAIVEGLSTLNLANERLRASCAKRVNTGDSFAVCFFSWY